MKVLMVSDVYFPRVNGVSASIENFHGRLAEQGVEVKVLAPEYGAAEPDAQWVTRVPAWAVPFDPEDRMMRPVAARRAAAQLAEERFDVVHIQTPFLAHSLGRSVARKLGVPCIATYHTLFEEYLHHYIPGLRPSWARRVACSVSRRQCNALDAVVVPSSAMAQRLKEYGVRAPLHVLPTGIPIERYSGGNGARFRARLGIARDAAVALFVGRVAHEKNIDFLLRVAARVRPRLPHANWLITGEGPALAHIRRLAHQLGIDDRVLTIGYLDRHTELADCYAAADVFAFASRTETQGLVLIEAMAAGVPVVALSVMGTADLLVPGRGALVPADDECSFAAAVTTVLSNTQLRQDLSASARHHAAQWSDVAMAGRLATLYRELAA